MQKPQRRFLAFSLEKVQKISPRIHVGYALVQKGKVLHFAALYP